MSFSSSGRSSIDFGVGTTYCGMPGFEKPSSTGRGYRGPVAGTSNSGLANIVFKDNHRPGPRKSLFSSSSRFIASFAFLICAFVRFACGATFAGLPCFSLRNAAAAALASSCCFKNACIAACSSFSAFFLAICAISRCVNAPGMGGSQIDLRVGGCSCSCSCPSSTFTSTSIVAFSFSSASFFSCCNRNCLNASIVA